MAIDITVSDSTDGIDASVVTGLDTRTDVSDDGSLVVADAQDINMSTNLSVTDDGDGSVTVTASGGGSALEVQEDGSSLSTDVSLIDFIDGVTATEPTADEIDVNIDESVLKDGGSNELDAADLAGGLGSANQFLQTDGAAASWVDLLAAANTWTATQTFADGSVAFDVNDQAADPTANGEVTRNGSDVKIYSGGSVRNVSNIGSGGSNGLVPLRSITASSQSSVDFDQGNITSTYRRYEIRWTDVVPATDGATFHFLVSADGGSNYKTGASDYKYARDFASSDATGNNDGSQGDSKIPITGGTGGAAGEAGSGTVELSDPSSASHNQIINSNAMYQANDGDVLTIDVAAIYLTAEAINAVRFTYSSGNIASGTFDLYGVTKP